MTNANSHESRRRNSGRTKPSWRVIKFYKRIHDSTILYAVLSESPFLSHFSFLLSLSLFVSVSPSQSYNSLSHNFTISLDLPRISDTFRTYSFYRMSLSRRVIASKITQRIKIFFSLDFSLFLFAHSHFFLSLIHSYIFSLFLPVSFSHIIAIIHTAWPLEIVVYLTMIYLHVTYTSTSQLVGSPFFAYMILPFAESVQKGERVSLMYNVWFTKCVLSSRCQERFPQRLRWTLARYRDPFLSYIPITLTYISCIRYVYR